MVTPNYLPVSTDSRVCPFKMYLKGVLDHVTDIHVAGWNCVPHYSSHCVSHYVVFHSQRIKSSAKRLVCDDTAAERSFINAKETGPMIVS